MSDSLFGSLAQGLQAGWEMQRKDAEAQADKDFRAWQQKFEQEKLDQDIKQSEQAALTREQQQVLQSLTSVGNNLYNQGVPGAKIKEALRVRVEPYLTKPYGENLRAFADSYGTLPTSPEEERIREVAANKQKLAEARLAIEREKVNLRAITSAKDRKAKAEQVLLALGAKLYDSYPDAAGFAALELTKMEDEGLFNTDAPTRSATPATPAQPAAPSMMQPGADVTNPLIGLLRMDGVNVDTGGSETPASVPSQPAPQGFDPTRPFDSAARQNKTLELRGREVATREANAKTLQGNLALKQGRENDEKVLRAQRIEDLKVRIANAKTRGKKLEFELQLAKEMKPHQIDLIKARYRLVDEQGKKVKASASDVVGMVGDPNKQASLIRSLGGAVSLVDRMNKKLADYRAASLFIADAINAAEASGQPTVSVPGGGEMSIDAARKLVDEYARRLNDAEGDLAILKANRDTIQNLANASAERLQSGRIQQGQGGLPGFTMQGGKVAVDGKGIPPLTPTPTRRAIPQKPATPPAPKKPATGRPSIAPAKPKSLKAMSKEELLKVMIGK